MRIFRRRYEYKRLNQMIDDAIRGEFNEVNYDESVLSQLECKWRQYLTASKMSLDNVEEERKSMKELVSDISHQTRTPLANIKLYSQLLEEQSEDGPNEYVEQIRKQADKLEFLIQALIKMSRLESETIQMNPIAQKVAPLLENVYEECVQKAAHKKITVHNEIDKEENAVYDLKWTSEALYNALDNAIKYSEEGTDIYLRVKQYEMYTRITVEDQGIGILEQEREKVFQRFYRSPSVQQKDGIGIGLFLAREIISKQHGYMKAMPNKPKGTIMALYLPSGNCGL
ncbi:sensor protein resE [Lachnospiraceae bacterium KM106-2]|nr:sensor protein resE [Lachnospiraceae bacterium KM106-2]